MSNFLKTTDSYRQGARTLPGRYYTAPEILLADPFDQRADVYSIGVLLWEAIMGTRRPSVLSMSRSIRSHSDCGSAAAA